MLKNNIENIFMKKLAEENIEKSILETRSTSFSESLLVNQGETLSIAKFPNNVFSEKIGTHPDFFDDSELPKSQYICSIFLDIKGSTKLALKYDLELVQKIKNAVLSTGIEIIRYFGGHVHRLQGDAIFAFTGHGELSKSDAIIQALNATSVIQYMNKTILQDFFTNVLNVSPLKIRIGIDFGDDKDVLWSKYGIDNINEVTVTSLHADLASKLQSKSFANKIMIGENIFSYLQLPDGLLNDKLVKTNSDEKDYYVMKYNSFNYKMKEFDWEKYLNRISHFDPADGFQLKCYYESNGEWVPYYSEKALGKDENLVYQIEVSESIKEKILDIEWQVINSGIEAEEKEQVEFIVTKENVNEEDFMRYLCTIGTSYNGLHYMVCKIKSEDTILNRTLYFSLFVNDNDLSLKHLKQIKLED